MRLLIITQKVDVTDSNLGFFIAWIERFARRVTHVHVICLCRGVYEPPHNVSVYSLGKEAGARRFEQLREFFRLSISLRNEYDSVFVHMNPIYVVLGGILWRAWGKRIGLWYTHGAVSLMLRLAERLAHVIFTASVESFGLRSAKVVVTGHGIDTDMLMRGTSVRISEAGHPLRMITVGRIAPSKRLDAIVEALAILKRHGCQARLSIVGAPTDEREIAYETLLRIRIAELGLGDDVAFLGPINHDDIGARFERADLFVSMSDTGSLDKSVLEAFVLGLSVMTGNIAFRGMMPASAFIEPATAETLAARIEQCGAEPYDESERMRLSHDVLKHHSLPTLIITLTNFLEHVRN